MNSTEMSTYRHQLLALRNQLNGDVSHLSDEALRKNGDAGGNLSNTPIHMADLGTDNFEQEFTLGLAGERGGANAVFALVSVLAAGAIVYWSLRRSTVHDWSLCAALGLILAGTLGNLYDRLVFGGVRDFLHWYRWFEWPVFNVADCCLVCGAFLLLAQAFWNRPEPVGEATESHALRQEVVEA